MNSIEAKVADALNNLGGLLLNTGDHAAARRLIERGLQIKEHTLGPNHPAVATSLNNLAEALRTVGDHATANHLHQRALAIREQALGPNHPEVAQSLNNLALTLEAMGDYAQALQLYHRAVKVYRQALGPNHPEVAMGLNNAAVVLMNVDRYAEAKALSLEALLIRLQTLGPAHPDVAESLSALAHIAHETGETAAAEDLFEGALGISEKVLGSAHPRVAQRLTDLAFNKWDAGRPHEALPKLARAVAITRGHLERGLSGLSNRQKLLFLRRTASRTDGLLSLPSGLVLSADAYRAVLDRKNLLFRNLAAERVTVEANPDPQVAALFSDYAAILRQLTALTLGALEPRDIAQYQTRLVNLSQRLETLQEELSRASAIVRQTRIESTAGPSELCAVVPQDAALIDLFLYSRYFPPATPGESPTSTPHYVAFVLVGGACSAPIRVELGPAGSIDEDVRRFRDTISRDVPDPAARELRARYQKTLATRLYAKLFPPVLQQAIAGKPKLIVSPDGALAVLPFGFLPGEDDHEFLLETRTISYIPSGRDLLRVPASRPVAPAILAVGAPAFDLAPVQVAQASSVRAGCGARDEPFGPLPGTLAELKAIASVYQQGQPRRPLTLLEGSQATKAALLGQAPNAGILHLATHAYFAEEECTPAGMVSEQRKFESLRVEGPAFLGHNPLLLSGIALAGANEREKADGILTALEITTLDLRVTDLVVLSACDTGLGTAARSQELLGLRWAFAYAGAKNLVTSLWSVPDAETATLMTHFYAALWIKGLSVSEALRSAQLEMLKAARALGDSAPHTWGAFIASGLPN